MDEGNEEKEVQVNHPEEAKTLKASIIEALQTWKLQSLEVQAGEQTGLSYLWGEDS